MLHTRWKKLLHRKGWLSDHDSSQTAEDIAKAATPFEKQVLLPQRAFYIRPAVVTDAPAIARLWEHLEKHYLTTQNSSPPLSYIRQEIASPELPNVVQLVAISTPNSPAPYRGLLGYIYLVPFSDSYRTWDGKPMTCYDCTASMYLRTLGERFLDTDLYYDIVATLIDDALSKSRDRNDRYKTVVVRCLFSEGQPMTAAFSRILTEKGFKRVGLLEKVIEKDGLLLDQVYLQKTLN